MTTCPTCGSANEAGDSFCFSCGHRLDKPTAPQPPPTAPQPPPTAPRTPWGLPRGLLIAIGIAGVAIVGVLVVVFATSGKKSTSASPSPIVTTAPPTTASQTQTPSVSSSAPPSAQPTESVVPSGGALVLGSTCTNDQYGYQVGYPQGWYASEGSEFGCQFFDPAPLDITPNTEVVGIAVSILLPYDRYGRTVSSYEDPYSSNPVSHGQTTVGGLRATVIETEATGNGYFPQGTMTYAYVVNLGGYGLALITSGMPGEEYETHKQVIDLMVGSMSFFA